MDRLMRNQAFSLIEVMISLVILMVGIMGLAVAFQRTIFQATSSRNDTAAMMVAQAILDELDGHNFDDIALVAPTMGDRFHADFEGNFVADPADPSVYYVPSVEVIAASPSLVQVEIRVNWTGWRAEFERGGYGKDVTDPNQFAFVLNASIAQTYGEDLVGGP
ncbi:MAG: prepilin-type N-terminal cleavage/methylation domain-containing protein [Acidobacteria bacterium]|nr:prepilin-type N-terminal cleavage/methylation domain-containing protein [Acidobacteriota bacterium]